MFGLLKESLSSLVYNSSLAPVFYRNIMAENGGPIKRLVFWNHDEVFTATATLSDEIRTTFRGNPKTYQLYGNVDGCGTSSRRRLAQEIAISEAIERWAFWNCLSSLDHHKRLGFDVEPSTRGMAAFPGLFRIAARHRAFLEEVERYSVEAWWNGLLGAKSFIDHGHFLQPQVVVIENGFSGVFTVILKSASQSASSAGDLCSLSHYGFAAGLTMNAALEHARVELNRNLRVLNADSIQSVSDESHLIERRLAFFAQGRGSDLFDSRVRASLDLRGNLRRPHMLVDSEVSGPWSKYATVWRCLLDSSELSSFKRSNDVAEFSF